MNYYTYALPFGHRTPMTVIPVGGMAEIDCDNVSFNIIESGVS